MRSAGDADVELLRLLTLVYAGVLVLALAVSLIAVVVYLRRIAAVLGQTRQSLSATQQRTAALEVHLTPLSEEFDRARSAMSDAAKNLVWAHEQLAAFGGELDIVSRDGDQEA